MPAEVIGNRRRLLIQIQLKDPYNRRDAVYTTDPGANPILYMADGPGGPQEYGIVSAFGIDYTPMIQPGWRLRSSSGGYGEPVADPDGRILIRNIRYPWQRIRTGLNTSEASLDEVFLDQLFSEYLWDGAAVTIYRAVLPHNTITPSLSSRGTWKIRAYRRLGDDVEILLSAPNTYKKSVPDADSPSGGIGPAIVSKAAYPHAPEQSIGEMLPEVYCGSPNLDQPYTSEEILLAINPQLLGNVSPAVIVNSQYDPAGLAGNGASARVVVNKHAGLGSTPYGFVLYTWIPELGTFGSVQLSNLGSIQTGPYESYCDIPKDPATDLWLNPVSIFGSTLVTNPERCFNGKATDFATLDQATSEIRMSVPSLQSLGRFGYIKAFAVLSPGIGVGGPGGVCAKMGMWDTSGAPSYFGTTALTLSRTNVEAGGIFYSPSATLVFPGNDSIRNWQWYSPTGTTTTPIVFKLENQAAGVTSRLVACGFWIEYTPTSLLKSTNRPQFDGKQFDINGRLVGRG